MVNNHFLLVVWRKSSKITEWRESGMPCFLGWFVIKWSHLSSDETPSISRVMEYRSGPDWPIGEDTTENSSEDHLMQDPTPHSTREVRPYRPDTSPVNSWGSSPLVTLGSTESLVSTTGFENDVHPASPLHDYPLQDKNPISETRH